MMIFLKLFFDSNRRKEDKNKRNIIRIPIGSGAITLVGILFFLFQMQNNMKMTRRRSTMPTPTIKIMTFELNFLLFFFTYAVAKNTSKRTVLKFISQVTIVSFPMIMFYILF